MQGPSRDTRDRETRRGSSGGKAALSPSSTRPADARASSAKASDLSSAPEPGGGSRQRHGDSRSSKGWP